LHAKRRRNAGVFLLTQLLEAPASAHDNRGERREEYVARAPSPAKSEETHLSRLGVGPTETREVTAALGRDIFESGGCGG